jgi:sugar phosphate isomerase/epimerase
MAAPVTAARPLALSTMYLQGMADRRALDRLASLALDLGFAALELGHAVEPEALERLRPGVVPVRAVHHPCPARPGDLARLGLVAADADERQERVSAARRSLETAERYGARVLVLHAGGERGELGEQAYRLGFELTGRWSAGQASTPRYRQVLADLRAVLERIEAQTLTAVRLTLDQLLKLAVPMGISLALETPFQPHELPRPGGLCALLDEFAGAPLGGWVDTGHVEVQTHLGLEPFAAWDQRIGGRWLGAHLHDAVGLRDHLPAGMGTVDFEPVLGALPRDGLLTCEFDWYFEPAELRAGRERLEQVAQAASPRK